MIRMVDSIKEANCVTHSGTMHADEVFATAFLDMYIGNLRVFRTSKVEEDKLSPNTFVYDIGRGRFDHHQEDALKRENGITYSSFGLLWKEFGRDYLIQQGIQDVEAVFLGIDKDLVEGIDADDNGFFPKIEASYRVKTLPNVIKLFNPSFESNQKESSQFLKAVELAKMIMEEEFYSIQGKVIADKKVCSLLDSLQEGEKYLILDEYLPYEESVLNHEKGKNLLFVAFPSNRGGYAIKVLPKSLDDKTSRISFPEEWGGKVGEELERISGISGLTFCHTGRFIVNCRDLNSVLKVFEVLCQ